MSSESAAPTSSTLPLSQQPDLVDRPRFYQDDVTWCLEQVAAQPDYPYRSRAVFVVHGIGAMDRSQGSSVDLRYGFEDAADALRSREPATGSSHRVTVAWNDVPATYIKEGYWGNYRNVEGAFPDLIGGMPLASRSYFKRLWDVRSRGSFRTGLWLLQQAWRLVKQSILNLFSARILERTLYTLLRPPIYILVLAVVAMTVPVMLFIPWGRKALADVVGDVRLYVDPRGAIEHAMVQWIDKRVAALFLQLLGLDLEFNELPDDPPLLSNSNGLPAARLRLESEPFQVDEIVWVSHSLGTLVSYNVLSDLIQRCQELQASPSASAAQKANAIKAVNSIHRFYTLGSPLEKIALLFPGVLRPWPEGDWLNTRIAQRKQQQKQPNADPWWVNFNHILDPVSGIPVDPGLFHDLPETVHSPEIWTLPGLAHVSYWHTLSLAEYILHQTQFPEGNAAPIGWQKSPAPLPRRSWIWKWYWNGLMIVSLFLVAIVEFGTLWGLVSYYTKWLWAKTPGPLQGWLTDTLNPVLGLSAYRLHQGWAWVSQHLLSLLS